MSQLRVERPVLIVVAVLLSAGTTVAQTDRDDRTAGMRLGLLSVTPAVTLSDLGWDSNVFNTTEDPKGDFTFTLTPGLEASLPVARRIRLDAGVASPLVYYHTYESQRSANVKLRVRAEAYMGRARLFAVASHVDSRERSDLEIDQRVRRLESGAAVGGVLQATARTAVELSARRTAIDFEDGAYVDGNELREVLNRDESTIAALWRHRATALTGVGVRSEFTQYRFDFSPIRDADSVLLMPGVELKPRALISGSAHIGYRRLRPRADALPDFDGLAASVAVSYALRGTTLFTTTFDRDIAFSFETFEPYFLRQSLGGRVRRHLGGRFEASGGLDHHTATYRALAFDPAPPPMLDRREVTRVYSGSLGYRIGRSRRAEFGVSYWTRISHRRSARTSSALRLGITVTYGL